MHRYDSHTNQEGSECDLEVVADQEQQLYNGVYYFESDHLALKTNPDYHKLLKTIALLEVQKIQAVRNNDDLHQRYEEALADPIHFVDRLQRGVDMNLPKPQTIASLPRIDFSKYIANSSSIESKTYRPTRKKNNIEESPIAGSSQSASLTSTNGSEERNAPLPLIRGRLKQDGRSETFNKLWSMDEQRRLEQLLIEFPEEEVESRRCRKIANALGTRTPQQVASRIQKYFIKLAKAGLSVPGRVPSLCNYTKKTQSHQHHRYHQFYKAPSTFLASHQPPVYMSDHDDIADYSSHNPLSTTSNLTTTLNVSDEEDICPQLRDTPQYRTILRLKKLKKTKLKHTTDIKTLSSNDMSHKNLCQPEDITKGNFQNSEFSCDLERKDAVSESSSDTIDDYSTGYTPIDSDYLYFQTTDYNYLDPNFIPAT